MTNTDVQTKEHLLVSVYDEAAYPEARFQRELEQVHELTAIEREWAAAAGLLRYNTDAEILDDVYANKLVRVNQGVGYICRQYLREWTPDRSDPDHEFHYSPPFLSVGAFAVLSELTRKWQAEMGAGWELSITSLVRSSGYQERLAKQRRKLTITSDDAPSSHEFGIAFDIDGCGLVERDDWGNRRSINPRAPGFNRTLVAESRFVLRHLLDEMKRYDIVNFVEELPHTEQHCFHVAVKPEGL